MTPLTTDDIRAIRRALRKATYDAHKLAALTDGQTRKNYEEEERNYEYLIGYFDMVADRIYRSQNLTARINCKL